MTDVSDGLLADLGHVASASEVSVDISLDLLAADLDAVAAAGAVIDADVRQWVLGGGEDHALVATFPTDPPPGWRRIGRVRGHTGSQPRVTVDGVPWHGTAGWESFRVD